MRKECTKPVLKVIVRKDPEESVLVTCKNNDVHGTAGPNSNYVCTHTGHSDSTWCIDATLS